MVLYLAQVKRTLKKMENIFSQEDDDGKKCLLRHICFKEMFVEDNFSPHPPPEK